MCSVNLLYKYLFIIEIKEVYIITFIWIYHMLTILYIFIPYIFQVSITQFFYSILNLIYTIIHDN